MMVIITVAVPHTLSDAPACLQAIKCISEACICLYWAGVTDHAYRQRGEAGLTADIDVLKGRDTALYTVSTESVFFLLASDCLICRLHAAIKLRCHGMQSVDFFS